MNKIFKAVGLLEGLSSILLFFVAMPMKYLMDNPSLIRPVGMAHGVLFVIFVVFALILAYREKWDWKKIAIVNICAFIPLGTFYVDKKYL